MVDDHAEHQALAISLGTAAAEGSSPVAAAAGDGAGAAPPWAAGAVRPGVSHHHPPIALVGHEVVPYSATLAST